MRGFNVESNDKTDSIKLVLRTRP